MSKETSYTPEIAERICDELASGKTLREICRAAGMPDERTVRRWVLDKREGFDGRYNAAREIGYHTMADEVLEIADDGTNDWMDRQRESGERDRVVDHEHITRSRLRFDARRWLLSKALPKVYGDKLAVDAKHDVSDNLAELMKQIDGRTKGLPKPKDEEPQ